jgi:hypothetical protein
MKTQWTFNFLRWKITLGLSVLALLFNFAYFLFFDRNVLMALKMSGSSLISIGAMHIAHSINATTTPPQA